MAETTKLRVVVGADHAGLALKRDLVAALGEWGVTVEDLGTHDDKSVDYPDFAHVVATRVAKDRSELGLLVCGSGIGMSIAANRHSGARAVVCSEGYSAKMARAHNDANILCLGARVVGAGLARDILRAFLDGTFEGGRHAGRVAKIENKGA